MFKYIFTLALVTTISNAQAQLREIPALVKEAFTAQYPTAQDVSYKDQLTGVHVAFLKNDQKHVAKYTNKGLWRETELDWNYGHLDTAVKDGFRKSKYAEWKTVETKVVYRPTNVQLYRIKVEKGELNKRYLYFNKEGRLLEDAITL